MEIKKRNRTELKSFFVKNAIPTEGEFADLIDGMLNQKEDGIAKLPGSPLSIEASGDDVSQKKAINFYKNFADPNPSWVLSLNPRSDPAKPATAKPGFSISDAAGNSKLFIDQATTGHVGIGTVDPKAKLDVVANTTTAGGWYEALRFSQSAHSAITHPAGGLLFGLHGNRNFYFGDIKDGTFRKYVMQINAESGLVSIPGRLSLQTLLDFGAQTRQMINLWKSNYGIGVQSGTQYFRTAGNFAWYKGGTHNNAALNPGGGTVQMVIKDGNVGIGTDNPGAKLDVNGGALLGYETSVPDFGGMLKSGFYQNDAGDEARTVPDKVHPWSHLITARHSNTGNNHQLQIGASYAENDKLYFRKIARGPGVVNPPWHEVATRGANTFTVGQNILSASNHLLLDRSASETTGGKFVFLELRQYDGNPAKVPVVYPSIRFHHGWRFWHRIEGRPEGFYFKQGDTAGDALVNIYAASIHAGNSDIYFTNPNHNHTGIGNAVGYAAIENAKNYDALMILGRAGTTVGRKVRLWDYLEVRGTFVNHSDQRSKTDVETIPYGLNEIKKLRPVSFNWKKIANPHKSLGFIAQELRPVINEVVYSDTNDNSPSDPELSVSYIGLIPVLVNAIKELDVKVENLLRLKVRNN